MVGVYNDVDTLQVSIMNNLQILKCFGEHNFLSC